MSFNIIDIIIILLVLCGAVMGFKNGVFQQLVNTVGFIAIVIIAFLLKNPVSNFLYTILPFFKFDGVLKGITSFNILLYEVIAFVVVFGVLLAIFRILVSFTNIFEKILKMTIILGIPSKLLGAIVGAIEYFIFVFVLLYIVSLPIFNIEIVHGSKYKDPILNNTPVLSSIASKSLDVINDFVVLVDKYEVINDPTEFNIESICLFRKYNIVNDSSTNYLLSSGKVIIKNANNVEELNKVCEVR